MSLCSKYFLPGPGSNVHKTYFYFLKLMKLYFIVSFQIKAAQYQVKNIHVTHKTD